MAGNEIMTQRFFAYLLLMMSASVACQDDTPPVADATSSNRSVSGTWQPIELTEMSSDQQDQRARAGEAKETLFRRLLSRLQDAITNEGFTEAIQVCQEAAPQIASEVSGEMGLQIGRTSFKLRNPENTPPDWARPLVDKRIESPSYLTGPEGQLAALLPIRLQPQCTMCHGTKDEIPEEMHVAIARAYPNDQATGFHIGDLRGWFWIEVPPR